LGSEGWPSLRACRGGRGGPGDQQLGRVRDRRHVGDRPIAGVGQLLGWITDPGGGEGGADGDKHRGQLLEVVGLLGELGGDHDLLEGGGRLGVVALQGAVVATDEAAVGVGGVDGRLGVGGLIAPSWPDVAPGSLASGPGRCGQLGDSLLVALLAGRGLGFQPGFGVLQPGQPLSPAGQCPRQFVAAAGAVLLVLGPISLGGLLEQLSDLDLEAAAHSFSDWISRPARAWSWRTRNRAMVT
jgi:hypothetical protein